jgi:hypothetical protein
MKFFKSILLSILILLLMVGCELYGKLGVDDTNNPGSLPGLLKGEWVYIKPGTSTPAERYVITGETIEYGYGSGSPTDFKGDIRFVSNYNSTSGVIIIEYTVQPSYPLYNDNSFYGIYYRNLKTNSVQLANAINLNDYSAPDTNTLEEAIEKFTRLKMSKYVDWSVVQPQVKVGK